MMRKIIILFMSFIFLTSAAKAASLNNSYFTSSSGVIGFDSSFIKDLLEANGGEQSALTDYYNEMVAVIKERFGLDFDKDVEHIGFYLTLEKNNIQLLGFLSGNFNLENMETTIKENIASEPDLLKSIVINDKEKPSLQIDQNIFIGQNNHTIWFCDEPQLKYFINNKISFENAPTYVSNLINKSNFIFLKKELWGKLFNYDPKKLKIDLDNVKSISAYINNFDVFINVNLDTNESAEVLKLQCEYLFKSLYENKESLEINDSCANIFKKINSLYLSARISDILNSLKLEVKDNTLVILFPYDRTNFYNAASDFITNIAVPAYQKIIEENSIATCYHAQHIITKAIDRYNSENEPLMTYYDNLTLNTSDCLPYEYSDITRRGCRYTSVGKLDEGGYIACEQHGPAIPLIKPQITKERYEQENEMLLCFSNMRAILEAIQHFNSRTRYRTNRSKLNADNDTSLISTELNIELLKEKGFLNENYMELPNCEYYIKGDMTVKDGIDNYSVDDIDAPEETKPKKGYVGCKKHGLLTEGQLYNTKYDFSFRRPNSDKKEVLKQIIEKSDKQLDDREIKQ